MRRLLLRPFALLCLGVSIVLSACSRAPSPSQETALPSGKRVQVLTVGTYLLTGSGEKALMLSYQTRTSLDDVPALRKEAEELWTLFQPDAEASGHKGVILSAQEPKKGMILKLGRQYNFVIKKDVDGRWTFVDGKGKAGEQSPGTYSNKTATGLPGNSQERR
jgi:hypothetical protein